MLRLSATSSHPITTTTRHGGHPVKRLLISLLLLPLLFGCSMYDASNKSEADQMVGQYHDALKAKQWETLLTLYDPDFFKEHDRHAWQQELSKMFDQYGALNEIRQTFTQKDPRFRGDYYIYGYRLAFDKATISETITVFKGLETDKLTIAGQILEPVDTN